MTWHQWQAEYPTESRIGDVPAAGGSKCLVAPRVPVDGVFAVLSQIWRRLLSQAVHASEGTVETSEHHRLNFGGLFADGSARWVVKDNCSGCPYTVFVGVLGAFTGGFLMSAIDSIGVDEFSILSVLGRRGWEPRCCCSLLQEIFGRTAGTRR